MGTENKPITVWEVIKEETDFIAGDRIPALGLANDSQEFGTLVEDLRLSRRALDEYAETHQPEPLREQSDLEALKLRNQQILARTHALADQVRWAEVRVAEHVYARSRATKLTGLCLSGGGIRSATFGLGILEGLAQASNGDNGEPTRLLREFDYLSTVSGGGYIGGWFSSWVARCTFPAVVRALQHGRGDKLDPDAEPVSFLREYSNYLNPKLGVTSADTWALVATVLRNILLNWLVLLPLIGSVLVVPRLLAAAILWLQQTRSNYAETLAYVALVFGMVAFCCLCFALPASQIANPRQAKFLGFGLLPTVLGALLFTVYATVQHNIWGDIWAHWWLCLIPVVLGIGLTIYYGLKKRGKLDLEWIAGGLVVVVVTGGVFLSLASWIGKNLPQNWTEDSLQVFVVSAVPVVLVLVFAGMAVVVGLSSRLIEDEDREWFARAAGWILIITVGWLLLTVVSIKGPRILILVVSAVTSAVSGSVLAILGHSAQTPATKPKIDFSKLPKSLKRKEVAIRLLLPVFIILSLFTLSEANVLLLDLMKTAACKYFARKSTAEVVSAILLLAAEFLISLAAAYFINVNKFSLHGMYKLRLVRAYLGASRTDRAPNLFTGFDAEDNIYLKELRHRPVHVVNMALNLVAGTRLSWQQRKAASFTATPFYAGSLWWGYRPTEQYSDEDDGMSLGGAVTISGAAASPNMGYHSSPLLTIVMTLFNARLGAWLGNTGKGGGKTWKDNGPSFGWRSYIDELFGLTNEVNKWIYLSDGGHFENLGMYEMVLRRCNTIVAVDAGCDKDYTFEDLANAVRKVRIDLGVPIEFPNGIHIGKKEKPNHHFAVGRIRYSQIDDSEPEDDGWLVYIKTSLTGDEPADVTQYARSSPDFPHESTADQWFSESQFESYRALGNHIVTTIVGNIGRATLDEFVQRAGAVTQAEPKAKGLLRTLFCT
jgi:hypothetical protein